MQSHYATRQEIQEQFLRDDFGSLIKKLEAYAFNFVKGLNLSVQAMDIVYDVLLSVQKENSGRMWDKENCPNFNSFLFGSVKSHSLNLYDKQKNRQESESGHINSYQPVSYQMEVADEIDLALAKEEAFACLRKLGGDGEEVCVFECWWDGIYKSQEIADFFGVPVEEIYTATKRLNRKLPRIQAWLKHYRP